MVELVDKKEKKKKEKACLRKGDRMEDWAADGEECGKDECDLRNTMWR